MRMIGRIALPLAMMLAGTGAVATAQTAPTAQPATDATALPEPDPERLAAAERVVDRIWPIGTFRRVMDSTIDSTMAMVGGVDDAMADTAWIPDENSKEGRRAQHEARTGRPLSGAAEGDAAATAASEEAEAGLRRMNEALIPVFERIEPPIRAAIARIYARRYSLTELGELDAFFATPTGARYAEDSLTLMNDPEMVQTMASMMVELMPALMDAAMDQANATGADAAAAAAAAAAADAAVKVE